MLSAKNYIKYQYEIYTKLYSKYGESWKKSNDPLLNSLTMHFINRKSIFDLDRYKINLYDNDNIILYEKEGDELIYHALLQR